MRKRNRVLILAAIFAALVVRAGLAVSIDYQLLPTASAAMAASTSASVPMMSPSGLAVPGSIYTRALRPSRLPDGASLFGLGTVLIGLAVAVRRTV